MEPKLVPASKLLQGLYIFVVYTVDRQLLGAFGARDDANAAAKAFLQEETGGSCKLTFLPDRNDFWSWSNRNGEVTVEMTKLQ